MPVPKLGNHSDVVGFTQCRERGCEPLDVTHLPRELVSPLPAKAAPETAEVVLTPSLPQAVEKVERALIAQILAQTAGNKAKAARLLDTTERILAYAVKKHDVDPTRFRG
jgi:transcriptional regulator with GAF, ATPase, and Fis domain